MTRSLPLLLGLLCACTIGSVDGPAVDDTSSEADGGDEDDDGGGTDDSGAADDTSEPEFCDGQPVVTWANFGQGFTLENCQGCHASTATNRYGAPELVTFDTVDEAWSWSSQILSTATGDEPSMPPSGGVFDDDRLLLEVWLRCAEPGT